MPYELVRNIDSLPYVPEKQILKLIDDINSLEQTPLYIYKK